MQAQDSSVTLLRGQLAQVAAMLAETFGAAGTGLAPEAAALRLAALAKQSAAVKTEAIASDQEPSCFMQDERHRMSRA